MRGALIGMVVSWCNREDESGLCRGAGRGRVTATIPSAAGPLLLVEVIARAGDKEPSHSLIIPCGDIDLTLHTSLEAEDEWFAWLMDAGKSRRVVSLVATDEPRSIQ